MDVYETMHPALCRYRQKVMASRFAKLLMKKNLHLTTAESCTGGLIAATMLSVSGMSAHYDCGYITYANHAKERILGVSSKLLAQYGAVSREVALAMAEGALRTSGADIALSVTGIAGPTGGTKKKPVGLIYIGCAIRDMQPRIVRLMLSGSRDENRALTVLNAISLGIYSLENLKMHDKGTERNFVD